MSKKAIRSEQKSHCVRVTSEPYANYSPASECLGPVLITGYEVVEDMDNIAKIQEHHLPYDEDAVRTLLTQLRRRKRECGSYLLTYSVIFHCSKTDDLKWVEEEFRTLYVGGIVVLS